MKGPPPMHPVHHAKGDFDMTKDEFRRIERAMKQPEFAGMLQDYMLEISDPKNKDEYDEYLRQLQKEGDLPRELKLVKPQPGFCIKTTITSKKDKSQTQKLFINCCHTPIVECPSFDTIEKDGKKGQNWRLPYSAGKMRYDQNTKKEVCTTIDIAFHPHTFQLIQVNPQFSELVCQTALDGANQQMGERNEIISKDYRVLKNMKCKGGEPALLTVRISGQVGDHIKKMQEKQQQQQQDAQQGKSETERRQNGEGYESSLYRDILNQKNEYTEEQKKQIEQKRRQQEAEEVIEETQESSEIKSQPIQAPKFKIVYSYPVQYEDFLDRREENSLKRPIELTIEILLPRATGIKEINLDIEEKNLVLNVPEKYFLDMQLPYFVLQDEGSAKFEAKKKMLRIKLPINKSKLPLDPTPPKTYKEFAEKEEAQIEPEESSSNDKQQTEANSTSENNINNSNEPSSEGVQQELSSLPSSDQQEQPTKQAEKEPILEIRNKNLVKLNQLNQQEKQQFLEDSSQENQHIIEVVGEQQSAEQNEEVEDEDDIPESKEDNQKKHHNKLLEVEQQAKEYVRVNEQLKYKRQETLEKLFLIFNITDYKKQQVRTCIFDQQVLIWYQDERFNKFIRVAVNKEFNEANSDVSLVTDYVVINLDKIQQEYWNDKDITAQEDDFETFQLAFNEISEAQRLIQASNNQEPTSAEGNQPSQSNNKQENLEELDGLDEGPSSTTNENTSSKQESEPSSNENEQKEKPEVKEKIDIHSKEDTQIIKLNDDGISKNVLQFIEFKDIQCVFELD